MSKSKPDATLVPQEAIQRGLAPFKHNDLIWPHVVAGGPVVNPNPMPLTSGEELVAGLGMLPVRMCGLMPVLLAKLQVRACFHCSSLVKCFSFVADEDVVCQRCAE